jgi:hypothetical protein
MGFTLSWWTQLLGDLNGFYIALVHTGSWEFESGLHRLGRHSGRTKHKTRGEPQFVNIICGLGAHSALGM